jgi:GT2 family glycosyltransferase
MGLPSVTVIVVALAPSADLTACLDSVREQDYPPGLVDVVVVDNSGRGAAAAAVAGVRTLDAGGNRGFAGGVQLAAGTSTGDCLALVNDDVRLEPGWLAAMASAWDPAGGYPCVGGLVLPASGSTSPAAP